MLHYEIKEIELNNKDNSRKRLIIEFSDSTFSILSEFLLVDAPLLNWYILNEMKALLADEKDRIESSGNRTTITITKEKTKIEDLLEGIVDEEDLLASVILETKKFYNILVKWYEAVSEFNNEYET